jgi:DNA-binding response OmpR family regulator
MADAVLDVRLHLGSLRVVVVEANPLELEIACETLLGFGIRRLGRFRTAFEAQEGLQRDSADLVVVGSVPGSPDEYGVIQWLRRDGPEAMRAVPLLLQTGHTQQANVIRARDCGASVVLAKPVQPSALFERVAWLARDQRAFIAVPAYAGPDRRFQKLGPPPGTIGRRADDPPLQAGGTKEANVSQDEIDALLHPDAVR